MRAYKYILSMIAVLTLPIVSRAQLSEGGFYETYQLEIVLAVAGVVCVLALVALLTVWVALKAVLKVSNPETDSGFIEVRPGEEGVGFWRRLWNRLNDSVPVSQEDTIMTSHEYDGIKELDNRLPPWWLYSFYFTIIFAIVYFSYFHIFNFGDLQNEEYEKKMAIAEEQVEAYLASLDNLIDESNVTLLSEDADIEIGKDIFMGKCSTCHGQNGEGGVGPNFADKYWIHGGSIKDIFSTIKYGVPSKGMISWQSQLSPKEMQQVSSFIYTLEGTNPPNPKDPQGELFERPDADKNVSTDSTEMKPATMEAGM